VPIPFRRPGQKVQKQVQGNRITKSNQAIRPALTASPNPPHRRRIAHQNGCLGRLHRQEITTRFRLLKRHARGHSTIRELLHAPDNRRRCLLLPHPTRRLRPFSPPPASRPKSRYTRLPLPRRLRALRSPRRTLRTPITRLVR